MAGLFLVEQFLIERGEHFHRAPAIDGDVAGDVRAAVGEGDGAGVSDERKSRRRPRLVVDAT